MSDGSVVYYGASKYLPKVTPLVPSMKNADDLGEDTVNIHDEGSYKEITQEMYKQNLDLAIKNKTLSVLRSIYAITMTSLDLKEVAQRLVDTIVKELNFSVALISLIDQEKQLLCPVAITQSPQIMEALKIIGEPLEEITISLKNQENLVAHVVNEKQRKVTGNLLDILTPHVTQSVADEIEKITNIRTVILYPILLGDRCLGTLQIALSKKVDDLTRGERETLEQLMDIVSIALDRAQLHQNLKTANTKLQDLDKLKDEFVSLASHELRTPMTAIKGSLSTILEGYAGEVSNESREFLTAAYNENDRLIRLVNNLLNISRIEAGRLKLTITKVSMGKLINEVVANLQTSAKEKSLALTFNQTGVIPLVMADEDKVKEVLINLIGNAIKFTHQGGVTVGTMVQDKMLNVSVTDTGSGISKEDQALLFKKFSQVQGNYSKQAGGTGLGLYISKQIVAGLGGTIWLESTPGKGSTFFFSLPLSG